MIELYHNALSTCSQKVRLVLNQKGVDWVSHEIDLMGGENVSEEYLKINPKAQVPVLIHGDHVIYESTIINEYLDDAFLDSPMRPVSAYDRAHMRRWTREVDDKIHTAIGVITFASVIRTIQLQRPKELVLAEFDKIADPVIRNMKLSTFELGVEAPEFQAAATTIIEFTKNLSKSLTREEWLAGPNFSLAEAAVIPYVLRLEHLGMDFLWRGTNFQPLSDWIDGVKRQSVFESAVLDYIPAGILGLFKEGGKSAAQRIQECLNVN